MARPCLELSGIQVGCLKVLEKDSNKTSSGENKWICICECGNKISVSTSRLSKERIKSCGCHKGDNFRKHNQKHSRLYNIWCSMKQRCNENRGNYKNITYCKEWEEFIPFYEWSIANGYADNLTIDRINTLGNYEPSNCRWVSQKVQQNNRTNNTLYTLDNATHTLSEWSEILGIGRSTLSARILKLGWSVEKALTTPLKKEEVKI